MRSVAVAATPIIAQRSVRLYKAHRSLYMRFDDRFIVHSSRGASRPLLRAYTTFVVFGVLLVRSDDLQGCVHSAPIGTRYILQVDCWGFLFLAHRGIEQVWRSQFLLMSLRLFRRCVSVSLCSGNRRKTQMSAFRDFKKPLFAGVPAFQFFFGDISIVHPLKNDFLNADTPTRKTHAP